MSRQNHSNLRGTSPKGRAESINVSVGLVFKEIRSGALKAIKIGSRTVITDAAWEDYLLSRPKVGSVEAEGCRIKAVNARANHRNSGRPGQGGIKS